MRKFIAFLAFIAVFAVCSCQPAKPKKTINVVFGPGIWEYSTCVIDYDYYLNKVDSMKRQCYVHNISPSDYSFIVNTLNNKQKAETTAKLGINPPMYIKIDSTKYILGDNRVVECEGRRNFVLSEYEEYRIKCLVHFYDFLQEEDVTALNEVKKFGMPPNYKHTEIDRGEYVGTGDLKIIKRSDFFETEEVRIILQAD